MWRKATSATAQRNNVGLLCGLGIEDDTLYENTYDDISTFLFVDSVSFVTMRRESEGSQLALWSDSWMACFRELCSSPSLFLDYRKANHDY